MKKVVLAVALCAATSWGQEPRVIDLSALDASPPEWRQLGIPRPTNQDQPNSELRFELDHTPRAPFLDVLDPLLERALTHGRVEQSGLTFLTRSPQAAAVLEQGLAPLRAQLRDAPLVRITLIPLQDGEAQGLPLGPLASKGKALLARTPLARLASRSHSGWLNARSITAHERLLSYSVDPTGVYPVRNPRPMRINVGAAARLQVRRQADGRFSVRGVVECARLVSEREVQFDGLPLDLPTVDRLRIVGEWTIQAGTPQILATCSLANSTALPPFALCLDLAAGPPPAPPQGPGALFLSGHDASALLGQSYVTRDRADPFSDPSEEREERATDLLERTFEREDLPKTYGFDDSWIAAVGTAEQHLALAQTLAAGQRSTHTARFVVSTPGKPLGVLRALATEDRALRVILLREASLLTGCEVLSGGEELNQATVTVPTIAIGASGIGFELTLTSEGLLRASGSLHAVREGDPLVTQWGSFAQLERTRVAFRARGPYTAAQAIDLGEGPWDTGTANAVLEIDP